MNRGLQIRIDRVYACPLSAVGFRTTCDPEELFPLHDEMRNATQAKREPLRHAVRAIARCHASAHKQSGMARLRFFEDECPRRLITAIGQLPGQHKILLGFALHEHEYILRSRECRKNHAWMSVLVFGQDALRTVATAVINEII
jgi:hypothetical protein